MRSKKYIFIRFSGRPYNLISSQSINHDGRRGTTDDVATIPFNIPCLLLPLRNLKTHSCPFVDVVFPALLSTSPSCSFRCPYLRNCLRYTRGSLDVTIPSEFPLLHHGNEIVMHSNCILGTPGHYSFVILY